MSDYNARPGTLASRPASFRGQPPRKPLVEYCTNEWRNTPAFDPSIRESNTVADRVLDRIELFVDRLVAIVRAPKFRRMFLAVILLFFVSIVLWVKVVSPFVREESAAWSSLYLDANSAPGGVFGTNSRPPFPGITHVKILDPDLLPRPPTRKGDNPPHGRRLVFVGDIHGCREELESLLEKLHFNPPTDHLIAAGDIVSKGPDSLGVIDLLRRYKASCVRGNHDDRLLLIAQDLQSNSLQSSKNPKFDSTADNQSSLVGRDPDEKLALSMNAHHIEYLRSCPLILRVGELAAFSGETVVVHAGLVPGLSLDNQDPFSVMNMRIIDLATHSPSKKHSKDGSVPWFKLWNKYQRILPAQQRFDQLGKNKGRNPEKQMTVIYGHDAKKGLQIAKFTKGLDTGCVKGGKLTAMVVDHKGRQDIVQIDCKGYR